MPTIEEIRAIRWVGNHFHDMKNFQLIDKFLSQSDDRVAMCEALLIQSRDGMGLKVTSVSEAELDEYLSYI